MTELAVVDKLREALERVETPSQAKDYLAQVDAAKAWARKINLSFQVQNEIAARGLEAERKFGEILSTVLRSGNNHVTRTATLKQIGIDRMQSSRYQKLARIPALEFDTYIANTMASGREVTRKGALSLLTTTQKVATTPRALETFEIPAIDRQIAQEFGLEVGEALADLIVDSINNALHMMDNKRYQFAWLKRHGINDDGTLGESWTFERIGAMLGYTREYAENLYFRASHQVRGMIAVNALNQVMILLDSES